MLPALVDQLLNLQDKLSNADTSCHLSDGQSGPNCSNHPNQGMEILEKIFQHHPAVRCCSSQTQGSPSLTINITGPLNIKIIRDENVRAGGHQVSAGGNKYTAMQDGMDEIDADEESIGESDQIFRKELQKELNKLKFRG